MTTTPGHSRIDAELQIDEIRGTCEDRAAVVVRCIRGPVRLGARFHRIRPTSVPIDLELAEILFYGRPVDELDPSHTGLVTLRRAGTSLLAPGNKAHGWQIIQGANPSP
ncbi:hypothetical protein [Streptomyces yaizuensis]|uniref:Uncharacterized protein n=1 Tax=Streptomyces yaizuensis TaxID=2989713 RepID=A0ABQ5NY19_9ACTN|nr:hypothetical protein [Streptomyces sp. YSPA8]GLF95267.1 hypothetical protein SYYSPA8_13240 [Streptomyces sp. YSPA8]